MTDTANAPGRPVTLITGGSNGIGRALAEHFAGRGDTLYLVARELDRLRIAADEIERRWGGQVHIASFDLMQHDSAEALLNRVRDDGCHIDVLVNSAGIGFIGRFADADLHGIKALLQLNLHTPTELIHGCLPGMLERRKGGILNIASLAGMLPVPNLSAYSASKGYLISVTRSLAEELRSSGVTISTVVPGPVDTGFLEYSKGTSFRLLALLPMMQPETVARIAFEGFVSGQTVVTPGILSAFCRVGIKILPHWLLMRSLQPILRRLYVG